MFDNVNFTLYIFEVPRTALSQDQLDDFRASLSNEATRLFAAHGYGGVTMRALAKALGCSPMTPYRYFANKAEIFDAVRFAAAERFADDLERAADAHSNHEARLRELGRAYVAFAVREPNAYRIMFELDRSERDAECEIDGDAQLPSPSAIENLRGWWIMHNAVSEAISAGAIDGEPDIVAHLFWSGVHGIVALHLSGMLELGIELNVLVESFMDREFGRKTEPQVSNTSSKRSSRIRLNQDPT